MIQNPPLGRNNIFLRDCSNFYRQLTDLILQRDGERDAEAILEIVQAAANFSWFHHPGRYADGKIENVAIEIGAHLKQIDPHSKWESLAWTLPPFRRTAKRPILHVATTVYPVGGHSRLIRDWIKKDPDSTYSLVLIRQEDRRIPTWLIEAVQDSGGNLINFPSEAPLLVKAWWLRKIAQSGFDFVILHHHPDDIVPTVAFATPECPPVAIINHADHVFWLGNTVADMVIHLRDSGKELGERRRFARENTLLPCPLLPPDPRFTRVEARRQMNIPQGQVVLLSIGTAYKYMPTETHNFFKTTVKILNRNPSAHLYLMGVPWDERTRYLSDAKHERFHFLGYVENPSFYQMAADVYLEGFPFGSQTALLETGLCGAPPVLAFAPTSSLLVTNDIALEGLVSNPQNEDEYIEKTNLLIQDSSQRSSMGTELRERILSHHVSDLWYPRLEALYEQLKRLSHFPHRIPNSNLCESQDDLALSEFHQALNNVAHFSGDLPLHFKSLVAIGLKLMSTASAEGGGIKRRETLYFLKGLLKQWVLTKTARWVS